MGRSIARDFLRYVSKGVWSEKLLRVNEHLHYHINPSEIAYC